MSRLGYMSTGEIIEYYDSHPNVTLKELSRMSGWAVSHLKRLLMDPETANIDCVSSYVAEGLSEW